MYRKYSSLLWGLAFLGAGIGFAGDSFGMWDFQLFFKGWWTLFIIIPCAISIIEGGFNAGNSIGLSVGIILLLSANNILPIDVIDKLAFPIVLVIIGLNIILKGRFVEGNFFKPNMNREGIRNYSAFFGGQDIRLSNETFCGANLSAIFGGIELNCRNAIISENIYINSTTIFGGVNLYIPSNVKVKVISTRVFGGVSNKSNVNANESSPTITINAMCVFGGVEIH